MASSLLRDSTTNITVRSCPVASTMSSGTGAPGSSGAPGPTGAPGKTGPHGPQGPKGATGATGPNGANGANGATGATGAPGADGMCTTVTGAPGLNGTNGVDAPTYHGSFYSDFSEQLSARYISQPMRLSQSDSFDSVILVDSTNANCDVVPYCSAIRITQAGMYNLQFSAQLHKVAGNSYITADIWLARKNNGLQTFSDIPWTATRVFVPNDTDYSVAAWNFFIEANAGDEFQLMWSSSDSLWANLRISSGTPAGYPTGTTPPDIPGLIVTVQSVSH